MKMLGFGFSHTQIKKLSDQNEAESFPGAFKPIMSIKLPWKLPNKCIHYFCVPFHQDPTFPARGHVGTTKLCKLDPEDTKTSFGKFMFVEVRTLKIEQLEKGMCQEMI